jgi:hypothetical protein
MGILSRVTLILVDASLSNSPPVLRVGGFFFARLQIPKALATEKLLHAGKSALDAFLQCK